MATSPAHKFGQLIGDLLEEVMQPLLQDFCDHRKLYLDKKGHRPARKGKKLTWLDKYENSHDLDFVIEKNGTDLEMGRPVAFIEAAWRRYTKHSKNKAQEIQGAILPIADKYDWDKPFMGVILAGFFTEPSLRQMESSGFNIALFSYDTIIESFDSVDINVRFDESTPDIDFSNVNTRIENLSAREREKIRDTLINANRQLIDTFFSKLTMCLDRQIEELILIPLYGHTYRFNNIDDTLVFLNEYTNDINCKEFISFRIFVVYSNKSTINEDFCSKDEVLSFLAYIAGNQ